MSRDMYGMGGCLPPECGHEHPEWTPYPHGRPPRSPYYMTAYDIAVLNGFNGTVEEWLKSLIGKTNYEIYLELHPDNPMTLEEWEAATDEAKLVAVAAQAAAELARDRAESAAEIAVEERNTAVAAIHSKGVETLASIPDDYATLAAKVAGLQQRVLAHGVGLSLRLRKGRTTSRWFPKQIGHTPDCNTFLMDGVTYLYLEPDSEGRQVYLGNGPEGIQVARAFLRTTKYQYGTYVMQELFPFDDDNRGQVWVRVFKKGWSDEDKRRAWGMVGGSTVYGDTLYL